MKRQLSFILSGFIGITALSTSATAHQSKPEITASKAGFRIETASLKGRPGSAFNNLEELNLTDEQQVEVAVIQANIAEQLAEVLTPNQLESFETTRAEGGNMRSMMMSLSRGQRSSVMSIMRSAQADLEDILTAEQLAQIQESRPRDRN